MEAVIVTIITGCVSIFLAVLKQAWSSRKNDKQILEKLDKFGKELDNVSINLLQLKMDKYINRFNSKHILDEEELKELSEAYDCYKKSGGNGYYAEVIKKILIKSLD